MSIFSRTAEPQPEPAFDPIEALAKQGVLGLPEQIDLDQIGDQIEQMQVGDTLDIPIEALKPSLVSTLTGDVTIDGTVEVKVVADGINPKDRLGMLKPDLSLVPPAALLHTASAMMDGAAKYGPYNWRENRVLARVYVSAAMRHLQQFLDGEDIDPTSGVHHLGHASACCAILLDARETGNLSDDRPVPGAAGGLIRKWTPDGKFG